MNFRQRFGAFALALVAALTVGLAVSAPAHASGAYYKIKLYGYDRCLDVRGVDPNNGALLQTYSCLAGQPNQVFYVAYTGTGNQYQIQSWVARCLDVVGVSVWQFENVQQYTCLGYSQWNQIWYKSVQFTDSGHDVTLFIVKHSEWCLSAASTANGADVEQDSCTNTGRNYWELIPA